MRRIVRYSPWLLIFLPALTEYLEVGHLPTTARGLLTEVVLTVLTAVIISLIYMQKKEIEALALQDPLTGIGNRRRFDIDIEREVLRAHRTGQGLCLIFFDLDKFKEINDKLGHEAGDAALVTFAQTLSSLIRSGTDACYRFGGDEFAVLLTHIKDDQPAEVEDRLVCVLDDKMPNHVPASKGIVFLEKDETHKDLVRRADEAMYLEKKRRNER